MSVTLNELVSILKDGQKKEKLNDIQLLQAIFMMYCDDKFNFEGYKALIEKFGYEFGKPFLDLTDDERKQCFCWSVPYNKINGKHYFDCMNPCKYATTVDEENFNFMYPTDANFEEVKNIKAKNKKQLIELVPYSQVKYIIDKKLEEGSDEEFILDTIYQLYMGKNISLRLLAFITDALGYELVKEFIDMIPKDELKKELPEYLDFDNAEELIEITHYNEAKESSKMTVDQARNVFEMFQKQGKTDEQLLYSLFMMYVNKKLNFDEFDSLVFELGYELTDEFVKASPEERLEFDLEHMVTEIDIFEDDDEDEDLGSFSYNDNKKVEEEPKKNKGVFSFIKSNKK